MSGASIFNGGTTIISTANADNTYLRQRFTATDGQSLFTLTQFSYVPGTNSLDVFINGVSQDLAIDYSETSNTSFTIIGGVELGDIVTAKGLVGLTGATNAASSAVAAAASATSAAAALAATQLLVPANLPLSIANGGTGKITKLLAFNALAPTTTKGDLIVSDGVDNIKLPIGANGLALLADSTQASGLKWAPAGLIAAGAITTNTTLTAATIGLHAIAMAALGSSITLPDATTITSGGPRAIFDNTKGLNPVGIRDSSGVLICAIAAGGEGILFARDVSTAAGVWSVTGTGIEQALITSDITFSATYGSNSGTTPTINPAFVALDANTSMHFIQLVGSAGFAAVLMDNLGKVVSTPVTIAGAGFFVNNAFKISATSALVIYSTNAGGAAANHLGVVVSLTGASPTLGLSVGTAVAYPVGLSGVPGEESYTGIPKIAQLTSTLYVITGYTGGAVQAFVFSIAGAVITAGAVFALPAGTADLYAIYPVSATTAMVFWQSGTDINAQVVLVTGTTCSTPSALVLLAGVQTGGTFPAIAQIAAAQFIISYDSALGANSNALKVFLVAGTTITTSTALASSVVPFNSGYLVDGYTRQNSHLIPLTATTVLMCGGQAGNFVAAIVTVGAGTTATPTENSIILQGYLDFSSQRVIAWSPTEFILSGTYNSAVWYNTFKIAGNVITYGSSFQAASTATGTTMNGVKLTQGDYVTSSGALGLDVFRTTGDTLVKRSPLALPPFRTSTPALANIAAVSSNRVVLIGALRTLGGTGANPTTKTRILNVEIAA